jgi:Ca-activated chloride channel family protein
MNKLKALLAVTFLGIALGASVPHGPGLMPAGWAHEGNLTEPAFQAPPPKKKPAADPQEQEPPQGKAAISVAVDLVSLQVLVTDKKGNVLTGLQPENFTVYEDNVKQEISNFSPVGADMTVVMLVEYSRQVSWFVMEVWEAIYGFANRLRPGDWVAVIGYDMRPTILCDFTQKGNELYDALRRFNYPAFSESNLADAVIFALDRVGEIEGKVAVLLISTGLDTFSKHTYDEALKRCKETRASIYALSLGQNFRIRAEAAGYINGAMSTDLLMADNRLRSFADFTGGEAYFPRFVTEFPSIFENISIQLRNQYSIAYVSSNTKKDGKFRKIRVDVNADISNDGKPDELKVFTRKGYQAKSEGEK